jgi:hypothetical protein
VLSRMTGLRRRVSALAAVAALHAIPALAQSQAPAQPTPPPTSPLAIHVGDADLLIGGFMDMTVITRSTNTGNGIATSFGSIPFETTTAGAPNPAGNLSETRFSAQNSRLTLQGTSKVGSASLKGYLEVDFLGNTSTNIDVTSNSNALRMRLYWVQFQTGKFEFLAGQSWSMMTPNRQGLSPMPGDIFFSQTVDTNYQNGLIWGRTPGFRFIAHASSTVTVGAGIENPEQYVGGAVVLPAAFPAAEVDTGASNLGASSPVPNDRPDIIGKIAFDPKTGKLHQHIDAAVVFRGYKTFMPSTSTDHTAMGTGSSVNAALEVAPNLRIVLMNYWGNGSGRYIANANLPDFIVNPDGSLSKVKTWSGIYGGEFTHKKTLVYGYYSIAQGDQNTTFDANGTTPIGFGVPNSQSANHKIQEDTVGVTQTFFRDPKIGGMQLMVQYSYLKRSVFSAPATVASGTLPGLDAKTNMLYVNVRYILP